jgi:RNA polymerase sigma factor (sigma-70 family)
MCPISSPDRPLTEEEDRQTLVAGLMDSHGPQLRRFLLRRVRNVADVPDIVQEVFLRMLRIPEGEAIRSPEAYLFTVARHVAQQHALREAAAPPAVDVTQMMAELQASADSDPAMQASADQALERLDRALDRFSPKVRAVFILHRHHGLSLDQISKHLCISVPMTKKYLVKALLQIRQQMEGK